MVRPAAGRISEWTGLDPSACFGVSLFRHEIGGYKGQGLVTVIERVLCFPALSFYVGLQLPVFSRVPFLVSDLACLVCTVQIKVLYLR